MPPITSEDISKKTEQTTNIVNYIGKSIADAWQSKNVKSIAILFIVILLFFNPPTLTLIVNTVGPFFNQSSLSSLPSEYIFGYWMLISILFFVAIAVAVKENLQNQGKNPPPGPDSPSSIKGLRSFTAEDSALFARLQRHNEIKDCLGNIDNVDFTFGILHAESGCGKSSFLQAGLYPRLKSKGYICVYVKLTEADPLQTIRYAFSDELKIPYDKIKQYTVPELFNEANTSTQKSVILILDQFEQFFVHFKKKSERKFFIDTMAKWFQQIQLTNSHKFQKVLVSIRADFLYQMSDFQKEMNYSLTNFNRFDLEKFEPQQAKEIFRVIASEEKISFDEDFVEDLTRIELAGKEDGKISPVDIQVLAWMVNGQRDESLRSFNREAYQKMGGIEGLLERYLKRNLDHLESDSKRHAALQVLISLIDLEKNTRAGILTLEEIKSKITTPIPEREIDEAVTWLSRPDIRLITPVKKLDKKGFELAHEKLIHAIRRLADKLLEPEYQINLLLNQRVNEWIGNRKSDRFLLSFKEWRRIQKENKNNSIIWGNQETLKKELLQKSQRKYYRYVSYGAIIFLLLIISSFIWNSSWAEQRRIKDKIISDSNASTSWEKVHQASIELFDIEDTVTAKQLLKQALQLVNNLDDANNKARALASITQAMAATKDTARIRQAFQLANKLDNAMYKSSALTGITQAITATKDTAYIRQAIQQVFQIANAIDNEIYKSSALASIVHVMAATKDTARIRQAIQQALQTANTIDNANNKSYALAVIAHAMATTKDTARVRQAFQITNKLDNIKYKSYALAGIVHVMAATKDTARIRQAIQQALQTANTIDNANDKSYALASIAQAMAATKDTARIRQAIQQALQTANTIDNANNKSDALASITQAMIATKDTAYIRQALQLANTIDEASYKSYALSGITQAMAATKDTAHIRQAIQLANKLDNAMYKSSALTGITQAITATKDILLIEKFIFSAPYKHSIMYSYINQLPKEDSIFYNQDHIDKLFQNIDILNENIQYQKTCKANIAILYAKVGKPRRALQIVNSIQGNEYTLVSLASILKYWKLKNDPELAGRYAKRIFQKNEIN